MKKLLIVTAITLLTGRVFSQDFHLIKMDSLQLLFKEGIMEIRMKNYKYRFDSAYLEMTTKIGNKRNDILKNNEGLFPMEIRCISNPRYGDVIKYYNEPDDESSDWALQQNKMWNFAADRPRGKWRLYLSDQKREISFIVYANDSADLQAMLKKDLFDIYNRINAYVKTTKRNSDIYNIEAIDTSLFNKNSIIKLAYIQKYARYIGKLSVGPALDGQQVFVATSAELSRVYYKDLTPKFKVGVVTTQYYGKNYFSKDSGSVTSIGIVQLKYTQFNSDKRLWLAVKIGVGGYSHVSDFTTNRIVALGFSMENARLLDYDFDWMIPIGTLRGQSPGSVMLTVKLPF